jgi:hypothetical protein
VTPRFSSRLDWHAPLNRLSESLSARRAAGREVLDLTESNPTAAGFDYPAAGILAAFRNPCNLEYHPSPAGLLTTREAVSRYYEEGASADRIFLTASTSEAYSWLFKLLCDPGDEVLVPRPSYPLFEFLSSLESVWPVQYALSRHGEWAIDFHSLESAVTSRTRAVVLVNPNNPTGSYLKRDEYARLAALGLPLISDEVFSAYAFAPDPARVPTLAGRDGVLGFSLSGLSKLCGLPQMKLGWIVVNGPESDRLAAIVRLELIADTYLPAGAPVQNAAATFLSLDLRDQISRRTRYNLAALRARTGGNSPCRILPVEGGWYATLQVPRTRTEEEWALELLERDGVLVQPGYFYDFESEAYLVLSLLTHPAVFEEGVARLLARIEAA